MHACTISPRRGMQEGLPWWRPLVASSRFVHFDRSLSLQINHRDRSPSLDFSGTPMVPPVSNILSFDPILVSMPFVAS